ncbi:hypothetical protein JXA40_10595 [bacterium]|nr:hypothetical protein [candidate division CSSED10-310 bacterium]
MGTDTKKRFWKRAVRLIVCFFMILPAGTEAGRSIRNWSNGNGVLALRFNPFTGQLWSMTSGGLVKWDWRTGQHEKYTTNDFLSDNWCLSGVIDKKGVLWCGTMAGGIMMFDGFDWTSIKSEKDKIPYNEISAMSVDPDGRIYAGFGSAFGMGLGIYEGMEWNYLTVADGLCSNYIYDILTDPRGAWIATRGGLNRIENARVVGSFTESDGLPSSRILCLDYDTEAKLWIGTDDGLSCFQTGVFRNYTAADGLPDNRIQAVRWCPDGRIRVGTPKGLAFNALDGWHTLDSGNGLSGDDIRAIELLPEDHIALGIYNMGIDIFHELSPIGRLRTDDFLPDNDVRAVAADGNRIWFGTSGGGIGWFDGSEWWVEKSSTGIGAAFIRAIALDHQCTVWFATFGDGIYSFDGIQWCHYTRQDGLPVDEIMSIFIDDDGSRWFATWGGGICRFDGSNWWIIDADDGLPMNMTHDVHKDLNGYYWFTLDTGVVRFDGTGFVYLTEDDGLVFNRVYDVQVDRLNWKWFGACKGLSIYDDATFTNYYESDSQLSHYRVRHTCFLDSGIAWMATGNGLTWFDGSVFQHYRTQEGMASAETYKLAFDDAGRLWAGSEGGLSLILPGDFGPCTETGVAISMPSTIFQPGDYCWSELKVCNATGSTLEGYYLIAGIMVYGEFFFAPAFQARFDSFIDDYPCFPEGSTEIVLVPDFIWPEGCGQASGITWYAALLDPELSEITGSMDTFSFGWRE